MSNTKTIQDYRKQEMIIFSTIPGMNELLQAKPEEIDDVELRYPDAAFALRTANNLFYHDRELSLIAQNAYFSILRGENIASVRFRFDKETDEYLKKHMWDD